MPLRKMRSRSLAVVELVLSLSVSKAGCMAVKHWKQSKNRSKQLFYNVLKRWKVEMGAACYSALSVSFIFISGCIFPLQIPTLYLLNTMCVEDWNATGISPAPHQEEQMGLDYAVGFSRLLDEKRENCADLVQMQYADVEAIRICYQSSKALWRTNNSKPCKCGFRASPLAEKVIHLSRHPRASCN